MNEPMPAIKGETKPAGQVLAFKEPVVCARRDQNSLPERRETNDDYGRGSFWAGRRRKKKFFLKKK